MVAEVALHGSDEVGKAYEHVPQQEAHVGCGGAMNGVVAVEMVMGWWWWLRWWLRWGWDGGGGMMVMLVVG